MTTDAAHQYSQAAKINELISRLDLAQSELGGTVANLLDAIAAGPGEAVLLAEVDSRWTLIAAIDRVGTILPALDNAFALDDFALLETVHPDDVLRVATTVKESLTEQRPFDLQFRVRRRDGDWRFVRDQGQVIVDRRTRPQAVVHRLTQIPASTASDFGDEAKTLRELIRQLETEQRMTACEIHDGFVQLATGALMHLEASDIVNEETCQAKRLLREALGEARRLMGGLQPSGLEEAGVPAAIDDFLATANGFIDIPVALHLDAQFPRLTPTEESTLFRILQEAINNACKHSQSERIRVRLRYLDGIVDAEVRDWGRGFECEETSHGGFGMSSMRQRAKLLGGRIQVTSAPGEGTIIRFRFEATR
ncbi:sensor histidine kinase [Blastopirellula retiformator]|uniref:Signal transduction histidine-protein kinase/phosphatase DegS n=1 Tax=Blastopirellula retiformator TaxID=2527970 RepID=A0A5C5USY2_9BACT|nr:ATP-binding protein [Blastopirellula retiformator]TWT29494.1 Signal transduction histidine-protein kinase/phosphatase DegS [Blastopirellula retiformator]